MTENLKALRIENWFRDKISEYNKHITAVDKNKISLEKLNNLSNNFLMEFYYKRATIHEYIKLDKELTEYFRGLCSRDFLFWILFDATCTDKRRNPKNKIQPMVPYLHQLQLIDSISNSKKHLHVEKSRRQGASLILLMYNLWQLIFHKDLKNFTTHKDKLSLYEPLDDINSTFGKLYFSLRNSFFFENKDLRKLPNEKTQTIIYKTNSISGEVLSPNTAVGFQADGAFIDEIDPVCEAYPNQAYKITSGFAASSTRIFLYSTYRSTEFPFYQIKQRNDDGKWNFIVLDWKDHPLCNFEWYDEECSKLNYDPVLIARELDHNPTKSIRNQILNNLNDNHFIKYTEDVFYAWKKIIMADFGGGTSSTVFICAFYRTDCKKLFLYKCLKTTTMTENQVKKWIESVGFDNVPVAGDRSGNANATTPQSSWKFLLQSVGITFIPVDNRDMQVTHNQINLALLNDEIYMNVDEPNFRDFYTATRDKHGVEKNKSSHTIDAFGYGYKYLYPVRQSGIGWL